MTDPRVANKESSARALARPDLYPEQFISWLRRFVSDNNLFHVAGAGGGSTIRDIEVVLSGVPGVVSGVYGDVVCDLPLTILGWTIVANASGSIVVSIWKDVLANFPPTVADKITASAPPTLSSATHSSSTTLTGWTTSVSAGDVLRFNVDSVSGISQVTLALKVRG